MKRITILVVVISTALLAAAYGKWRHAQNSLDRTPEAMQTSAAPVREDVVVHHVFTFEPKATAPAAPPAESPQTGEPTEISPAEYKAQLEAAFQADKPADHEANAMASALSAAFQTPAAHGINVDQVECHATRCRLNVRFDDVASDRRVMSQFFELISASGVNIQGLRFVIPSQETDSTGGVRATIHVFRGDEPASG
jgi:hypothetical protein